MSNSPLISYTRISPNKSVPRNHKIDTITIHCVAGNATVETLGNIFAPTSRQASCNYGVASDGRIGMYCEEKDRSWCTSSAANDNRAITIEVSNDGGAPDWHVSDKAMYSLIQLCADICKRNGIKKLLWQANKNLVGQVDKQNMTVHRWFANKSCPGDYLYGKHSEIVYEVNKILSQPGNSSDVNGPTGAGKVNYMVTINTDSLNVRSGPGTNYPVAMTLKNDKNTYTIVEETSGLGASTWCKLKSGAGWISKDFVKVK